jgi:hypothetical protein
MRIFDQWIDEGKGLFLNREIVMFTFYGEGVYWGRFVRMSLYDIPSLKISEWWGSVSPFLLRLATSIQIFLWMGCRKAADLAKPTVTLWSGPP